MKTCMFVKMQLDTAKTVLKELFLVLIVGISLTINKWIITYTRSTLHQLPSNQRFARLAKKEIPSYYSLQQNRRKAHRAKQRQASDTVADLNKIAEEEGEDGEKLKEELSACQYFLVDIEMENGRHKVLSFQMSKFVTKVINERLDEVINRIDSAKINIVPGFFLRIVETGEYRNYYKHIKNNTLFEKSHLLCTKADLITIQRKLEKFAIVEPCTQEGQNTKWMFKLIKNVIIFISLQKKISNGMSKS